MTNRRNGIRYGNACQCVTIFKCLRSNLRDIIGNHHITAAAVVSDQHAVFDLEFTDLNRENHHAGLAEYGKQPRSHRQEHCRDKQHGEDFF